MSAAGCRAPLMEAPEEGLVLDTPQREVTRELWEVGGSREARQGRARNTVGRGLGRGAGK